MIDMADPELVDNLRGCGLKQKLAAKVATAIEQAHLTGLGYPMAVATPGALAWFIAGAVDERFGEISGVEQDDLMEIISLFVQRSAVLNMMEMAADQ